MGYVRYKGTQTEYAGESFSRTISKKDNSVWHDTDVVNYSLVDTNGVELSSGALVKSEDSLSMTFIVPSSDTASLEGKYKLLVSLTNSNDASINNVIAEYTITYETRKA